MSLDLFPADLRAAAIDVLHAATAIYTAEPVVEELLSRMDWPRGERRLVDPSCGDGAFLAIATRKLLDAQPTLTDSELLKRIEGWEIHAGAAGEARRRVAAVLVAGGRNSADATRLAAGMVKVRDFITEGPGYATWHAIAGNPPYLRFANVPDLLRREYTTVLPAHARADLLHSFLDRCASALHSDGEIGLVTADRWLFNTGASGLRAALGKQLSIRHLKRLDASSAFHRPKHRRAGTPPRVHPVSVVLGGSDAADAIRLTGDPIYPDMLGKAVAPPSRTLQDIATVRLAPWLGTSGIFVVDAGTAARMPPECLVAAIDTDDIVDGKLRAPTRFALRTEPITEPPAPVAAHLQANINRMAPRGRRAQYWMPPESWHRLDLSSPSLLVPRIARTLRPVRIPAHCLPINHNLSIVSAGTADLDAIEAFLSSPEADEWVRAHAPRLEHGYFSLTPTLLRKLPVSDTV
jgi:hypothetical protein